MWAQPQTNGTSSVGNGGSPGIAAIHTSASGENILQFPYEKIDIKMDQMSPLKESTLEQSLQGSPNRSSQNTKDQPIGADFVRDFSLAPEQIAQEMDALSNPGSNQNTIKQSKNGNRITISATGIGSPSSKKSLAERDSPRHHWHSMKSTTFNETIGDNRVLELLGPLSVHCYAGREELVRNVLDQNGDPNMPTPLDKKTSLHFAAAGGSLSVCKLLVEEYGAKSRPDRFGMLPIHEAERYPEIRSYLYEAEGVEPSGPLFAPTQTMSLMAPAMGDIQRLKSKVFQLCTRMSDFSYNVVAQEVEYFFTSLGLHPMYFAHFTSAQIANHISVLIAAKKVAIARCSEDVSFELENKDRAFYLASLGPHHERMKLFEEVTAYVLERKFPASSGIPTPEHNNEKAQQTFNTYGAVANALDKWKEDATYRGFSVMYMASDRPAFGDSKNLNNILRLFIVERVTFDKRVSLEESDLQLVASPKFLRSKTELALGRYQLLLDKVVASKNAVVQIVEGEVYPGDGRGLVLQFATAELARSFYLQEIMQCFQYCNCYPKRFYIESFANGIVSYTFFFPASHKGGHVAEHPSPAPVHATSGKLGEKLASPPRPGSIEETVYALGDAIKCVTHFKMTPHRSLLIWNCVLQHIISPEAMIYVLALVKFAHAFFPKERLYPQFLDIRKALAWHGENQAKFDELYKKTLFEIITPERIYSVTQKHINVVVGLYDDFTKITKGEIKPFYNKKVYDDSVKNCSQEEALILHTFFKFNEAVRITNFYKKSGIPAAMAFRFDPEPIMKDRPKELYPEVPYGFYLVMGRGFFGWHVRFREVARGGIRLVKSINREAYTRNAAMLFDETYNLAFTQQKKNKDIPEGGSKGTILLDAVEQYNARDAFLKYIDSLLDVMQSDGNFQTDGIHSHLEERENLFFGPDENTADFMDAGALRAKERRYEYAMALTTGKSQALGGVPHDTYGMTTAGVHQYVLCLLEQLNVKEEEITKFQTGGPDGDLGSNEILCSKDRTVAIVDGSGVAYDPNGLNREELIRLAKNRKPIENFNRTLLTQVDGAFLVTVDEKNVVLPDGTEWRSGIELRNAFPMLKYAMADLFVPCGGRPNAITLSNVSDLINVTDPKTGKKRNQWHYVVEGANLFFTDGARKVFEKAGVHHFKDASANKGGVTSSSLEVLAALAMEPSVHQRYLTVQKGEAIPETYSAYVQDILAKIRENCQKEFHAIWRCCKKNPELLKTELTADLSSAIAAIHDSLLENLDIEPNESNNGQPRHHKLFIYVLHQALPTLLLDVVGLEGIIRRAPSAYLKAVVAAWIASRFVYESESSSASDNYGFYQFMMKLEKSAEEEVEIE